MSVGLEELRLGHYGKALLSFVAQLKAHPDDLQARYCSGVALQYLGRTSEARVEYERVAKATKDPDLLRRARKGISGCATAAPVAVAMTPEPVEATGSPLEDSDPVTQGLTSAPGAVGVIQRAANRASDSMIGNSGGSAPSEAEVLPPWKPGAKVVEAYADWCADCKNFAPTFAKAGIKYAANAKFGRIDIETPEGKAFCEKWQIHSYPTTLLFDETGKLLGRVKDNVPFEEFESVLLQTFAQ
jgi:thiol-disulfide isomerase/thioredoxin